MSLPPLVIDAAITLDAYAYASLLITPPLIVDIYITIDVCRHIDIRRYLYFCRHIY